MPNFKQIADQIAKGMFQEDWNKVKSQEEAIKSEQQRRLLATNADARAQAGEGREAEGYEYGKTRRKVKETADEQALKKGALDIGQGEFEAANRQGNLDFERKIKEGQLKNQGRGLDLESGRLSLAQKEALRMQGLTDMQINAMSAKQAEDDATRANRIESENFSNSPEGRQRQEIAQLIAASGKINDEAQQKAVVDQIMQMMGIENPAEQPGFFARLGGTTTAKRPPQKVIGSQGVRLPGMGPR